MMLRTTAIPVLVTLLCVNSTRAQTTPVILKVEIQNLIFYEVDTADSSKFGTNPNITPSGLSCNGPSFGGHLGNRVLGLGDIVAVNGQPAVQPTMMLTLSCDHRALDGARGAQFLGDLADLIEEPLALLA